jgi:hypothetical protein
VSREERAYEQQVGEEALERQRGDGRERHLCCGELMVEGHHPMCSKRPPDEPASRVDGQESLL